MSRKYKVLDQNRPYFITCTVVDWVDVFTRAEYKEILVDSLQHCQLKKGLEIFAWVIMTNHVHLIVRAKQGLKLENIIRDFKKYTSVALCRAIIANRYESRKWIMNIFKAAGASSSKHFKYQFWQESFHPVELSSNSIMDQKLNYLHSNPVRAGIVTSPESYLYSSAVDYYTNLRGMIEIVYLG
jgi:REP element-mobilizing transposase RayT